MLNFTIFKYYFENIMNDALGGLNKYNKYMPVVQDKIINQQEIFNLVIRCFKL